MIAKLNESYLQEYQNDEARVVENRCVVQQDVNANTGRPRFKNLMAAIMAQNQRETGDSEIDSTRIIAKNTIESYLKLPCSDPDVNGEDTFKFWRDYSVTTNKAQKALCHLARVYLTPPPTSTDVEQG